HILDGRVFDGLLNEVFSNEGVGSLVYGNDYQQIRRARKSDVRMIYNLTRNAVRREELVHRTQQAIAKNIDHFFVFEIDENIIACVTLYFYPDRPLMAEVGSLYVMPFYNNRGIGRKMVEYAGMVAKNAAPTPCSRFRRRTSVSSPTCAASRKPRRRSFPRRACAPTRRAAVTPR
ncbi:MAG: GNAT family N-acetyltransferase, partial [Opitutaceae bacterium]